MSKVYSLSGVRSAYLCCSASLIEMLRVLTPPWSVSLPAQLAAITALKEDEYYTGRYNETHTLRNSLKHDLQKIRIEKIVSGVANFLLCYLPMDISCTKIFFDKCKLERLYLRDVSNMGDNLGRGAFRIAVKEKKVNKRMVQIIDDVINGLS